MSSVFASEFWRLFAIAVLCTVSGVLIENMSAAFLIGISGLLLFHLRQLEKLVSWLQSGTIDNVPEGGGLWGELFDRIYQLQKRNKSQKQKLAAALTRFQLAASALPDAVAILEVDGNLEWCNEAAKNLIGLRIPQDVGHAITNVLRQPRFVAYFNANDYGEPIAVNSPSDENRVLSVVIVPYGKEQKLLIAHDMTRIQQLEQMRKDFVANVSHELRTPLTVINGYLETLEDAPDQAFEKWKKHFSHMREQSDRMINIVEELLMLSRLEAQAEVQTSRRIDVPLIIQSLARDAAVLGKAKHLEIKTEIDNDVIVNGNEDEITSAISNLVSNAVRYTRDNGVITLEWSMANKQALLRVTDTGIGIAAKDIPRLTERFYRADAARSRETGGTGLGLAIVNHVVNRHSATLNIESTIGVGSVFEIRFPGERTSRRS